MLTALAPGSRAAADGEPSSYYVPRVRGGIAQMPASGVLLIESRDSIEPLVRVVDADGVEREGAVSEQCGVVNQGMIYAWTASVPLLRGTYQLTLTHRHDASLSSTESLEVVAPFSDELPVMAAAPSAHIDTALSYSSYLVPGDEFVRVYAGLTSTEHPAKLQQYYFRMRSAEPQLLSSDPGSCSELFMKLEEQVLAFYERADEYCFVLEALRIPSRNVEVYPERFCAPGIGRDLVRVDRMEVEPDSTEPDALAEPDASTDLMTHEPEPTRAPDRASSAPASSGCSVGAFTTAKRSVLALCLFVVLLALRLRVRAA